MLRAVLVIASTSSIEVRRAGGALVVAGCLVFERRQAQVRLIDTPPSTSIAAPVVKLDASEAR